MDQISDLMAIWLKGFPEAELVEDKVDASAEEHTYIFLLLKEKDHSILLKITSSYALGIYDITLAQCSSLHYHKSYRDQILITNRDIYGIGGKNAVKGMYSIHGIEAYGPFEFTSEWLPYFRKCAYLSKMIFEDYTAHEEIEWTKEQKEV